MQEHGGGVLKRKPGIAMQRTAILYFVPDEMALNG
jgi:hypothetical protein